MAEQTILIDLQVSTEQAVLNMQKAQDSLDLLKQKEKELKKQWEENTITESEYASEMAKCKTGMEEQTNVIKANKDAVKQNAREQQAASDSLVSLRAELKKATTAFDNLSAAERNGAKGKELQQHISVIYNEISNAEQATGRFQRNVGNYNGKLVSGFQKVAETASGPMANGIKAANGAMKVMAANPIIAILSLLVTIIGKVVSSLQRNEEAFNRVKVAMSSFRGVGVIVQKIVDGLANGIAWLSEKVGGLLSKIMRTKDELKEERDLTKEEIKLKQQQRQLEVEIARNENRISELRLNATRLSKTNAAESKKMMQEAQRLEDQNYSKRESLAKKELELIRRRNAQASSGTKDIDAENEAEIRLLTLQKEHNDNLMSLVKKENTYTTAANNSARAVENEATAEDKAAESLKKRQEAYKALTNTLDNYVKQTMLDGTEEDVLIAKFKSATQELNELNRDQFKTEDEYNTAVLDAMLKQQEASQALMEFVKRQDDERTKQFIEESNERQAKQDEETAKAVENAEKQRQAYVSAATAISQVFGSLSEIFGAFGEDSKSAVIAQAAFSLAQVYMEQAVAIANTIAAATKAAAETPLGFWGLAGYIATGSAAVLTAISSTISTIKNAKDSVSKFATGGYVEGAGTGTSDSISARLSNGESVMTAKATEMFYPILSAMNVAGGGVPFGSKNGTHKYAVGGTVSTDALSATFRSSQMTQLYDAISKVQPVVSVKEITNVSNRVAVKEQIAQS